MRGTLGKKKNTNRTTERKGEGKRERERGTKDAGKW